MIQRRKKICNECKKETYIFSKGRCKACAGKANSNKAINWRQSSYLPKRVGKNIPKKTGELELFKKIWEEREHVCFVCSSPLPIFDVWSFAHLLAKGTYGRFRLNPDNILLLCRKHHAQLDAGSTEGCPEFDKLKEKKEKLKQQYYE